MNFRYLLFLTLLIAVSACEKTEKVENFPKHEGKLVTNCFFRPDTCFIFKLSKSLSPIDNAPYRNMNNSSAYIKVFENNTLFDSFRYQALSQYNFGFFGTKEKTPKAGNTYRFECTYPGFGVVTSEDFLPDTLAVTNAKGFYTVFNVYYDTDTMLTGEYYTNLNLDFKSLLTKNPYLVIDIDIIPYNRKGNIYGYYNYMEDLTDLNSSNESNYIANRLYVENTDGVNRINLKWRNSGTLRKNGNSYYHLITVTSCSSAAFEYMKRLALQQENQDDPFSEPTPISNNINNGYGIFGGINSQQFFVNF